MSETTRMRTGTIVGCCVALLLSAGSVGAATSEIADAVMKRDMTALRVLLAKGSDSNVPQPDGATALHWAAHWDDLEMAALLIRAGANVNATNDYGASPLWLACGKGSAPMVERLLKAGANPNTALSSGETALMAAVETGTVEAVTLLVSAGADVNTKEPRGSQTALMWAVAEKHPDVVRALIAHGSDVRARSKGGFTPLLFAAQQGDVSSARLLLAAGADVNEATSDRMSPLLIAAASGQEAVAVLLLGAGADPNAADPRGFTALDYAASGQHMVEVVKSLLGRGVDPNRRLSQNRRSGGEAALSMIGATPLLLAAEAGNHDVVRLLAANGADPSLATKAGTTPLMVAAGLGLFEDLRSDLVEDWKTGHLATAKTLVNLGVDINAVGENGWTALHGAAYTGLDGLVQILVDRGASMDVKDAFGQTPLSIAEGVITVGLGDDAARRPRNVRPNISDLLLKLGATPLADSGVQVFVKKQVP